MHEQQHWHPVACTDEVGDAPLAVALLGQRLVLWRDGAGALHAFADRCPHRGACLSLGRVQDGRLECPYHGWQFGPAGRCLQVPAMPDWEPPNALDATAYPLCERYGLLWVCLDAASQGRALPCFDAEDDAALRRLNCGPYDVATSAGRVVENFLDMAHFGFVHDGLLGSRARPTVKAGVVRSTDTGLEVRGCLAWQPQSNLHSTAAAQVEYAYAVTGPYTAVLTKVPDAQSVALAAYREAIGLFVCPVDAERSRVWFRMAVADHDSPDAQLRAFQHTIFMQDQPVLESQQPRALPLAPGMEAHSGADRASLTYRRFLAGLQFTYGVLP